MAINGNRALLTSDNIT